MATKVKLSKTDQSIIDELVIGTKNETVENPWSGATCELDARAVALYDFIKGSEALRLHQKQRKGLDVFRKLYPSEYMTLLD